MKDPLTYQLGENKNLILVLSVLTCIPLIFFTNRNGVNIGLLIIGITIGLFIVLLSIYRYSTGIYLVTLLGFVIFTLGRLIYKDLPWGTALELIIFTTTIGMLVSKKLKTINLVQFFKNPSVVIFTIQLLYVLISFANPELNSKIAWTNDFKRSLSLYCFFILIYIGLDKIKDHFRYGIFLTALCVIAAGYGCYQQFFGFADFEMNYISRSQTRMNLYFLISGIKRKFSLFSDPSSFGITMAAAANVLLCFTITTKFSRKTFLCLFSLALTLMGLAFSGTRTAYLAFAAGACFLLLLTINKLATRVVGIILFLVFAFIMMIPIYSNPTLNRVRSAFELENEASMSVRELNRKKVQPYIWTHPFGGGLGTTGGSGAKNNPGHFLAGIEMDSGYLRQSTELGWIGLIMMLFQYFLFFKVGLQVYFNTQKKEIKALISGCLVCLFTFVIAQYAQIAIGQLPDSFLFYGAAAIILKTSFNLSSNKII